MVDMRAALEIADGRRGHGRRCPFTWPYGPAKIYQSLGHDGRALILTMAYVPLPLKLEMNTMNAIERNCI